MSHLISMATVGFDNFKFDVSGFDMVIVRLSITPAPRKYLVVYFFRRYKKLYDGNIVMSNLFAIDHSKFFFGCYYSD